MTNKFDILHITEPLAKFIAFPPFHTAVLYTIHSTVDKVDIDR